MVKIPADLKYTRTHEWFRIDGDVLTLGISDYAQQQLTDIVYVDFPEIGAKKKRGDVLLTVESVKSAEDVYSPADGEVIETNKSLEDKPESLNEDCYGNWMVKLRLTSGGDVEGMTDEEYRKFIGES